MIGQNDDNIPPVNLKHSRQDLQSAISHASDKKIKLNNFYNENLPPIDKIQIKSFQNFQNKNEDQKIKKFSLPSLQNIKVNFVPIEQPVNAQQEKKLIKQSSRIENMNIRKDNVRAIKQEILNLFNKARSNIKVEQLFQDITLNLIASEMAENYYIYFQNNELKQDHPIKFKHACQFQTISGNYIFIEQDQEINDQVLIEATKQIINIFFESNQDKNILLNKNFNSCGVSIYINEESLRMVVVLAYNPIEIFKIKKDVLGKLIIQGQVKDYNKGLYAIKVVNNNTKKQIEIINYENIDFNIQNQQFKVTYNCDDNFNITEPPKMLEFYLRDDPSSIKYGQKSKLKHISKQLQVSLYAPLSYFPSVVQSKIQLFRVRKSFELKNDVAKAIEEQLQDIQDKEDKEQIESKLSLGEDNESIESDTSFSKTETEEISKQKSEQNFQQQEEFLENQKLKNELVEAINEASDELRLQLQLNSNLQQKLLQNWDKTGIKLYVVEGQNNDDINEIKYNNCLALTHQSNKELAYIKEKFEKQQGQLNEELQSMNISCKQIKETFMTLKNKLQKNGTQSQKKKQQICKQTEEISEIENIYLKKIQEEKVELIKLKMNFNKNQKKLNSKDQFAEGLHLIDFEKLKIENQSLNEKIEERNEEIFKLKKKNDQSIQILAHYQEKLIQENKIIQILSQENEKLEKNFRKKKNEIPSLEKELQEAKLRMAKLTQETGIVKNKYLKMDFIKRQQNIKKLIIDKEYLEKLQIQKNELIKKYCNKI